MKFITKPDITMYEGLIVDENTELTYENENVTQEIKDLKLKSITKVEGEGFKSEYHTQIDLKVGDVLVFEDGERGYIKPVEEMMVVKDVIEELKNIQDM